MTFKEFIKLEEKGLIPSALLGLSMLGNVSASPKSFSLPDNPDHRITKEQSILTTRNILASTLILEAGGEKSPYAMKAVFNVIRNRSTKKGTNHLDQSLKPYQFSCWNEKEYGGLSKEERVQKAMKHPKWDEALSIVDSGLRGTLEDITDGATHYHVWKGKSKVTPAWTSPVLGGKEKKAVITKYIDNHVFLKNVRF